MADTEKTINCPACGKEMKKVYVNNSNLNVDICLDGCGGIFFDNRELEKFDKNKENASAIFDAVVGKTFTETDSFAVRKCPVCEVPLTKMGAADGNVQIDVCNLCGGKFLDNGELQKIVNHNLSVNAEESVAKLMKNVYEQALLDDAQRFIDPNAKSSKFRQVFENIAQKYIV